MKPHLFRPHHEWRWQLGFTLESATIWTNSKKKTAKSREEVYNDLIIITTVIFLFLSLVLSTQEFYFILLLFQERDVAQSLPTL